MFEYLNEARDQIVRQELRTKLAEEIRRELVCPCVEELPDEPTSWHKTCMGAEFAARIVEEDE